jgi:hypothetical protein
VAERDTSATRDASPPPGGLAWRREQGRTVIALSGSAAGPGLRVRVLEMDVPADGVAPDPAQGPAQFRHRLCDLTALGVEVEAPLASAAAARLDLASAGIASLRLGLRPGIAEGAGTTADGAPFSFRMAVEPAGGRDLSLAILEPRIYAPSTLPAAALPGALLRAAASLGRVEDGALRVDPLSPILRRVLAPRGWKVPRSGRVRLGVARLGSAGLELRWGTGAPGAAEEPSDPDHLDVLEGLRAFREVEDLLARGALPEALAALRARGDPARSHPFAAGRLLSLLCSDPALHEEALALALAWRERRPGFPPALLAEAAVLLHRGDGPGAAR